MRLLPIVLSSLIVIGCGGGVFAPAVPLNEPFTLSVGESTPVRGAQLVIEFAGVSGDLRCPADAVCIQGGDALVHIRVTGGGAATYELHTGDRSRATAVHGEYLIALDQLQPFPFSGRTIAQGEYRATFRISRR